VQGEHWIDNFDKDFTSEDPTAMMNEDGGKPTKDYNEQFKDFG
jgi:serum/glucocorticoid-regulated kinase 2